MFFSFSKSVQRIYFQDWIGGLLISCFVKLKQREKEGRERKSVCKCMCVCWWEDESERESESKKQQQQPEFCRSGFDEKKWEWQQQHLITSAMGEFNSSNKIELGRVDIKSGKHLKCQVKSYSIFLKVLNPKTLGKLWVESSINWILLDF